MYQQQAGARPWPLFDECTEKPGRRKLSLGSTSNKPGSVVYVACGSELLFKLRARLRLAHGLELSGPTIHLGLKEPYMEKSPKELRRI